MGVTLNDEPLPTLKPIPLAHALIAVDWAHHPSIRTRAISMVTVIAPKCQTVRALGTAALAQAYLAAGRLQFYFNFGLQPWDVGAGAILVREAGGVLQQPGGAEWKLGLPAVFAGHPALLEEIQSLVSSLIE
jgi:myo-inositol-1(or 4)-monophosphatase